MASASVPPAWTPRPGVPARPQGPLGTASLGTDADIDRAVKAARRALDHGPWGKTTAAERADYMHKFAAALTARAETLELSGKSAAIFLDDGDIDTFLAGIGMASFMNNSQTCTTQSRILAPRSRYDEVVDALAGWTNQQVIGNPLDPSVTMGPMASEKHLHRVLGYIDIARNSNARLVSGGGRPKSQSTTTTSTSARRSVA